MRGAVRKDRSVAYWYRQNTVLYSKGHPLELTSEVAYAWIDGKAIDLASHQSQMKAKYDEKLKRNGK